MRDIYYEELRRNCAESEIYDRADGKGDEQ